MASQLQIRTRLITESRSDKRKIDGLPRIGQYAVEQIRKLIVENKITATGRTQGSIEYRLDGEKALRIIAIAGDRAPISTLQYGREPGGRPPVDKLKEWIIAKGLSVMEIEYKRQMSAKWQPKYSPYERGLNSMAWALSEKIKTKGTERYRNPNNEIYSPVLDEVIELFSTFIAGKTQETILKQMMQ